jgi:hypothetical protein
MRPFNVFIEMNIAFTAENQGEATGNMEVGNPLLDGSKNQICKPLVHLSILTPVRPTFTADQNCFRDHE